VANTLRLLEMARDANINSSQAWFYLADWHRQYGDKQQAIAAFNHVIELGDDAALVKESATLRDGIIARSEDGK